MADQRTGATRQERFSPAENLDEVLTYRISMVELLLSRRVGAIYSGQHGLTTHQWRVLAAIGVWGPCPAVEISQRVTVDKSAVSRAVRELVAKELVQRRLHDVDGRKVVLELTQGGRATFGKIAGQIGRIQSRVFNGLSRTQITQFFRTLRHIEERLRSDR